MWAPRQCGETWIMQQVLFRLQKNARFDVLKINLEHLKEQGAARVTSVIAETIGEKLGKDFTGIDDRIKFQAIFKKGVLDKPLILILDEFDALEEEAIDAVVSAFRNIHISRLDEMGKTTAEKSYLLHSVALIGVRSVLGIENAKGSPFNVQRSLHIPNLTRDEVKELFKWYEKESGQKVEEEVIDRLLYETRGQPGLTCWLGELLTEGFDGYSPDKTGAIDLARFERVYAAAIYALPNNNILNIISKAKEEANKDFILELFKTGAKSEFTFDDPTINMLYMNGVIDREIGEKNLYYLRFSSPFVQKRLFNYFSKTLFRQLGQLLAGPFLNLDNVITSTQLNIRELLKLYQAYLDNNSSWLFKDVPRRSDLRVYEVIYHFNLYAYIDRFFQDKEARVLPEFPTGNGKIDLLIRHAGSMYGIELKSFTDQSGYHRALEQAARYGKQLGLTEIFLVTFVETIDDKDRQRYEQDCCDTRTGVTVRPFFIETAR